MSRKRKKRKRLEARTAELNIMPFIDIFSMLNTFLLISASFVSIGILKVQVPFFSNSPEISRPTRTLEINVDLEKDKVELTTRWSLPPEDEKKVEYQPTPQGIKELHRDLIALRIRHPEFDKVTLFSEDDVTYQQVVAITDAIKTLEKNDPVVTVKDEKTGETVKSQFLYEKVVYGSVVL